MKKLIKINGYNLKLTILSIVMLSFIVILSIYFYEKRKVTIEPEISYIIEKMNLALDNVKNNVQRNKQLENGNYINICHGVELLQCRPRGQSSVVLITNIDNGLSYEFFIDGITLSNRCIVHTVKNNIKINTASCNHLLD